MLCLFAVSQSFSPLKITASCHSSATWLQHLWMCLEVVYNFLNSVIFRKVRGEVDLLAWITLTWVLIKSVVGNIHGYKTFHLSGRYSWGAYYIGCAIRNITLVYNFNVPWCCYLFSCKICFCNSLLARMNRYCLRRTSWKGKLSLRFWYITSSNFLCILSLSHFL